MQVDYCVYVCPKKMSPQIVKVDLFWTFSMVRKMLAVKYSHGCRAAQRAGSLLGNLNSLTIELIGLGLHVGLPTLHMTPGIVW